MDNIKRSLSQFIKAQVSASGASVVDFFSNNIPNWSNPTIGMFILHFIGACSGGICNCVTNYKWVFKVKDKKKKDIAWRYTLYGAQVLL